MCGKTSTACRLFGTPFFNTVDCHSLLFFYFSTNCSKIKTIFHLVFFVVCSNCSMSMSSSLAAESYAAVWYVITPKHVCDSMATRSLQQMIHEHELYRVIFCSECFMSKDPATEWYMLSVVKFKCIIWTSCVIQWYHTDTNNCFIFNLSQFTVLGSLWLWQVLQQMFDGISYAVLTSAVNVWWAKVLQPSGIYVVTCLI